jgi:8-oxo-dGTP pyrophosphatase MutT (NUDIX family)
MIAWKNSIHIAQENNYMLHKDIDATVLLPEIGRFVTTSERDSRNAIAVGDFVRLHEDAFDRNSSIGHITASAFILNASRTAVLLTHHAKLNCWLQVGGHCDGERDPKAVALKEAREETGLFSLTFLSNDVFDIDIHEIPSNAKEQGHLHFDIRYLMEADDSEPLQITSESKDLRWIPLSVLEKYTDKPSVLILKKKLNQL